MRTSFNPLYGVLTCVLFRFFWSPPGGGESMAQVCIRIDHTLNTLRRECSNQKVIIVCHGEVMLCPCRCVSDMCVIYTREELLSEWLVCVLFFYSVLVYAWLIVWESVPLYLGKYDAYLYVCMCLYGRLSLRVFYVCSRWEYCWKCVLCVRMCCT